MKSVAALTLLFASSCSGDSESSTSKKTPIVVSVPGDGGLPATTPPGVDPATGHIDDYGTFRPVQAQPLPGRERHAIDVTLRSSPPGALAAVDGSPIGPTPAFWSGYADGREHEFVFTLEKHAIARYRFVPVSSGVIHARLAPVLDERDAGVAPPPEVVPQPPPSAIVPPAPPPTIIAPDAAPAPGSAATPGSAVAPPVHVGPQP